MPITTKIVSLKPDHLAVYSIPHYVIKFVSDLSQVGVFRRILRPSTPIKLTARYNWNIAESGIKHHNLNPNPI
jgi:hypothetical protein